MVFWIRLYEMSANSIPESGAFSEGASLWIIRNNPSLIWWQKLDVNSHYLLSQSLTKGRTSQNYLLLGSEDHFLNKWILLWNDLDETSLAKLIERVATQLRTASIRVFSDINCLPEITSRLSASSISISYIENT